MQNKKTDLTLIKVHQEAGNVITFSFETGGLVWMPGQFQVYEIPNAGEDEKDRVRYFTIASAPSEQRIDISARISDSSFKQMLSNLEVGDTIQAFGIDGDFIWDDKNSSPVVFVAAGIGITPYRSILLEREANNQPLDVTLVYFNRTDEIPFLDTFNQLESEHDEFTFISIIGERVTANRILDLVPEVVNGTMYLSGPEPMVESVGEELKKQGINLKQDWFPGYTEDNF